MNITALDFLYVVLALGFISLVIFMNIVLYNIIMTLRSFRNSVENIHKVTKVPLTVKNKLKLTLLKGIQAILNKIPHKR